MRDRGVGHRVPARWACVVAVSALFAGGAVQADPVGPCPWDCSLPHNGVVDVVDFLNLLAQWGLPASCDLDGSGVSITDFLSLLAHWGPCPLSGGCCNQPGVCTVMTPGDCTGSGGVYAGNGTTCADADNDRIPTAFELNDCRGSGACFAGTNPFDPDTDHDGIDDGDEFYGSTGGLGLPALGADPCRKDIFIETDWVYANGQPQDRNKLHANQAARLVASFAAAPVANPGGATGIALHLDYGQAPYGGGNAVPDPSGEGLIDFASFAFNGGEIFAIKPTNFAANRNGFFHYCLMCDAYSVAGAYQNSSGLAELPGDDFVVSMGQWALGDEDFIGNTVMHELGHNLLLSHGGNEGRNFKPNYNSVMNYWYQFCGTDLNFDVIPDNGLDYSRNANISLNESSLVESAGVTGAGPGIDWSGNGSALDIVARNINCRLTNTFANSVCVNHVQQTSPCGTLGQCNDSSCNLLTDYDDWTGAQLFHLNDADLAVEIIHCLLDGEILTVRP